MNRHPSGVPLWGVALGALTAGLIIAGLVALVDGLRHPGAAETPVPSAEEGAVDPRIEVECPEAQPREGESRAGQAVVASEPQEVTSTDLHDCPETYDRALVSFRGEVVGSPMRREAGAWVQLNDDRYARDLGPLPSHRDYRGANEGVAVLLPHDVAERVDWAGGPGRQGDLVEVTGLFRRVDPDSRDMAVIRALDGDVVRPGGASGEARLPARERAATLLAALAVGLVAAERLHARRWRRG